MYPIGYVNDVLIEDDVAWVSSDHGLVGIALQATNRGELSQRTISSIPTSSVTFDNDGDLWVGTSTYGIMRIDADGSCQQFDSKTCTRHWFGLREGVPSNNVLSILAANDGSVWAGTPTGLGRYRTESGPKCLH